VLRHRDRTGVLVITVWLERDSPAPFFARITAMTELEAEERKSVVVASVDEVIRVVREWVATVTEPNDSRMNSGAP
jgi:hypothetical protein